MSGKCICKGGKRQVRDEFGWTSSISLEYGKEHPADEPHWFLRFSFLDKCDGTLAAENYPARYCPTCGRELK